MLETKVSTFRHGFNPRHFVTVLENVENKVSRILKDERYTGDDNFDPIVDQEIYDKANQHQTNMSTHGSEKAEVLGINVPVICPECHSIMKRMHDGRRKCTERWLCAGSHCTFQIRYSDSDFLKEIKEIVAALKDMDIDSEKDTVKRNFITAKLETDIRVQLKTQIVDFKKIQTDIMELATRKFDDIPDTGHTKSEMKNALEQYIDSGEYITLLNQTASKILMEKDKSLTVVLKDGTKQRRLKEHGDSSLRQGEKNNENSTEAVVG